MHCRRFSISHSIRIAVLGALLTCIQSRWAAADSPPYQARVIAAGAAVHSGPGENFYATDTLAQGDVVEVYRERPGGWLAIRPPVNSFSWVAEHDLILKDGGLAEATKDNVASRIGSRLNDRHNASQVRLKRGEAVEVLGAENIRGEKWCKIAPPAGEFRWIQASLVERAGPIPTSPATALADTTSAAAATVNSNATPPLSTAKTPDASSATKPSASPPATNANAASPQPPAPSPPSPGDLPHELTAIELRLSRMVAAPTNLWNTERLERDTAQLMARAKTPAERDSVRLTQEKINHFAEIGRRNQSPTSVAQLGIPGSAGSGDPRTTAVAAAAGGGSYDAVGILRPVVSRRPGAPQFALVDERGQVVSFVTPTPDLNLQPYLGRRVGVVGNRGFMQEFQRSNVTAARVTPLNDRLLR